MPNTRSCLSYFLTRPCQGSSFIESPGLILFFLLVAVAIERPDAGLSTVDYTGKIPHGMWAASAAKRGSPFVFALRGGVAAAAGEGETVAIHRPRATSGIADITKSVRIGGSMTNSSELAWSWGATVDDPGPGTVEDENMPSSPRDGRGRSRAAYPTGRRREPRTQTQVIQGASDGGDFIRRKLFLGGTGSLVERDLWDFLEEKFGEVEDVDVIRVNDRPRGFAFVTFTCSSAAAQCIGAGAFHLKGYMVNVLPSDKDAPVRRARAPKLPILGEAQACNKVFLGGTRQLTESALLPMLQRFGDVSSLHVMSRPENMLQCAGYAFATMSSSEEARRLVNKGFITVANVTLEARFADEKSRPGISEKVSLFEVEELVASLRAEIARVTKYAPGGYRNHSPIQHEGIVFAAGTSFEHTLSQDIPASEEALDEGGRSISQLHQLLEDAEMLRTQVYDCLGSRVREAASINDVTALRHLVKQGASVNAPQRVLAKSVSESAHTLGRYDELAPRCLYLAAAQGHVEACGELLELGAEVDTVCYSEALELLGSFVAYTPLKVAAERGFLQVVKLLLSRQADANFCDQGKWSILHWAACNNHAAIVNELVAAGAHVNALNMRRRTPLALARTAGAHEAVRALSELGAVDTCPPRRRRKKQAG